MYVFVEGTAETTTTNTHGAYILQGVDAGTVTVSFIKAGYFDKSDSGVTVISHTTTTLNIQLVDESTADVIVWYGNMTNTPIEVALNHHYDVNVYIATEDYVYINSLLLGLGAQNQYIDSMLASTEGQFYYPFTEWASAEFRGPFGSPPNPAGSVTPRRFWHRIPQLTIYTGARNYRGAISCI